MKPSPRRVERRIRTVLALLLGLALVAGPLPFAVQPALAANLTVNTVGDGGDIQPGDGVCDASTNPGAQCSLRAAIQVANATPGADTIGFNIPGSGVRTIRPNSRLPTITGEVTIDGYTQPGAQANTATTGTNAVLLIELDGTNAGLGAFGLVLNAANSLVRGLVVNRFGASGLSINDSATGVRIAGCFIGTDAGGTRALGNEQSGIAVGGRGVQIGGPIPATRNLVSGNQEDGIALLDDATNAQVLGNLIGTTRSGADALGNFGNGIFSNADNHTIGGAPPGHPNTIAFNAADGIDVDNQAFGNRILVNAIFANNGLGIDLGGDGRTLNDQGDPDLAANFRQNFPMITAATPNRVTGTLNSNPNRTFTLRLFSNPAGGDEGRFFTGRPVTVTTDNNGNASFVFTPTSPIPVGRSVTVTATRTDGQTSEFSDPKPVATS